MVAIDQDTGKIKWQHKFPSAPYGAATVSNDLVWTTTFDGTLWALNKNTGAVVWHTKLPAGTNAPVAIDGDTVVTGAGFPEGEGPEGDVHRLPPRCDGHELELEQGRLDQRWRLVEQHRGQPEGGSEGVRVHLRLLPHARGGRVDRHRRDRTSISSSPPMRW